MRIAVFGAGAWGTAIARHAAIRHEVVLWARDASLADEIERSRQNHRYLPGVGLGEGLHATSALDRAAAFGADLHVLATSMAGLRPVVAALDGATRADVPTLWLCKGLEADTALLPHQVVAQVRPSLRGGVLSGPSFAQEVAAGLPVALTVAADDDGVCDAAVAALHHDAMRLYRGRDRVGVEVAGAVKNVIAIATGVSDGLGLGMNARAALLTRGLAEIARFGAALGARPDTFLGLAGVGDLVLTCTGELSRNRRVGLRIAAGEPLEDVLRSLGHVAEGVACCRAVLRGAAALGVDMPIAAAVGDVLFGGRAPRDMVAALLAREPKAEQ